MSEEITQETIERDKLLLDLMIHAYDEEERRNALVDSKNSQMIVLTGVMLTLQATLFTNLLVNKMILNSKIDLACKLILSLTMCISFVLYAYSLKQFIKAYSFSKDFKSINPDLLLYYTEEPYSKFKVQKEILKSMEKTMDENSKIIDEKVAIGSDSINWLKRAAFTTLIFIFLFLLVLFCNLI